MPTTAYSTQQFSTHFVKCKVTTPSCSPVAMQSQAPGMSHEQCHQQSSAQACTGTAG